MRRREFLGTLIGTGSVCLGNATIARSLSWSSQIKPEATQVKRVLTVFKCHFDAGFIDTQTNVVRRYFDVHFPKAIETAERLSQSGSQRYVWTTGSWLLYEYLEQATPKQRKKMDHAIHSGFIAWHALPFTWQTELMDPDLISGALALSKSLDGRFGCKTTGAKMTDVPGHTRGLVSPLAANGVAFLDIGVNDASTPAILPPLFRWRDTNGATIVVMYHHSYGTVLSVPGADFAIAIVVKDDNLGPHTPEEIAATYSDLNQKFPNAEVIPTNLAKIADALQPSAQSLSIITGEIGDTWIHGIASDPLKVARYRELCRLRRSWIRTGKLQAGDATDVNLLRCLLLEVEHTWGTDTKTWLDFDNYIPRDLQRMLDKKNYKVVASSWQEKRQDLFSGIDALPSELKSEATQAVTSLAARPPQPLLHPHSPNSELETPHFLLRLDEQTGAIHKLHHKASGRNWASGDHPLALFSYQTLSQHDYAVFFKNYVISDKDWAKKDFGKPNIERFGAESRLWEPSIVQCTTSEDATAHRILAHLEIRDSDAIDSGRAAFPKQIYLQYMLPKTKSSLEVTLYWFEKPPTRMPEALWLTFHPSVAKTKSWTMRKSGQELSPNEVVDSGNRHMHAISDRISCKDGDHEITFVTLDAVLVALGCPSPLNFSRSEPNLNKGIHFNLFNNAWGTNYIMWFAEDMRFRFSIEI
jgi:Domain of unknown function (DUF5054)